jgi:hypothetical protein
MVMAIVRNCRHEGIWLVVKQLRWSDVYWCPSDKNSGSEVGTLWLEPANNVVSLTKERVPVVQDLLFFVGQRGEVRYTVLWLQRRKTQGTVWLFSCKD